MRSTNFLTRLLSGIKAAQAENANKDSKIEKTDVANTGPAWKKAEDVEDEDSLGKRVKIIVCFI